MMRDHGYDGACVRMGNYRAWAIWYYNNEFASSVEQDDEMLAIARLVQSPTIASDSNAWSNADKEVVKN